MAKRTINLDRLDDHRKTSNALLLEGISKIAEELRRRNHRELEDALDSNYEAREKICKKRREVLGNVLDTIKQWPGDFDKIS